MMDSITTRPEITRLRHETRRRSLTVLATERLTPNMLRLRLGGPDLAGFVSSSPGDHIKLFVPDGAGGQAMRDYTPRRFDVAAGWLDIDFALHDAGPATLWALQARPGDRAEIGGPRGSQMIGGPITEWLLIGDETALPSIARRIEEMPQGARVTSLVAILDPADRQAIATRTDHRAIWVEREDPADPQPLVAAFDRLDPGPGAFVWIAAEAGVARALRDAALASGVAPEWLRAAGYWRAGEPDAKVREL
jgi:NADPH-dependent ferric siderophore reductase